jgi:2-polyprenyl-3-methyl-5-hydroxy-6-metoxy-1,4-benzoquinol methylase
MQYRERFYEKYASLMRGQRQPVAVAAADHQVAPYDGYLRGWLPGNREAAILDVACGSGEFLRFFAARGYTRVEGVDISPEQIELARALHPQVHCANALDFLGTAAGRYDLITARDVAEHLTKDEILIFFESCGKALRPGGRLIIQTPNGATPWSSAIWHGDFTHEHCFTAKTLGQVFALSGFKDYEAREMAPPVRGVRSAVRRLLWQWLRFSLIARNYIETGSAGGGVYTRVFLGSAVRPMASQPEPGH